MADPGVRYSDVKRAFEQQREARERTNRKAARKARRQGLPIPEFEENEDEAKFYWWEDWIVRHLGPDGRYDPAPWPLELNRFRQATQPTALVGNSHRAATTRWRELGPSGLTANEKTSGSGIGRVGAVAFHPTNAGVIYVAAPGRTGSSHGGLWKTNDSGQTWRPLWDDASSLALTDVAVSANNPETVFVTSRYYAPTGVENGVASYGLHKSTDGGITWAFRPFGLATTASGQVISLNPTDDQQVLVGCTSGLVYSVDGGSTWQRSVLPAGIQPVYVWDIERKPDDPAVIYASGNGREQVLQSTDGGRTFSQLTLPRTVSVGTYGRAELAVSAAAPDFVYLLTTQNSEQHGGLYRLNAATGQVRVIEPTGGSFSNLLGGRDGTQLSYCLALSVSPVDTNVLHIGMVPLLLSKDGGRTWRDPATEVTNGRGRVHADITGLRYQPGTNRLFVCTDGGLYAAAKTAQPEPFTFFNGIATTQIYFMAQGATRSDQILVGTQDNGTKYRTDTAWRDAGGGDGMHCFFDDDNPDVRYITYQRGALFRFTPQNAAQLTPPGGEGEGTSFFTPVAFHQDTKTLLFGSSTLWRKDERNYASAWEKVHTFTDKISNIWVAPSDEQTIYVREADRFWVTTDGGRTWQKVVEGGQIFTVTVHPQQPNTLWVFRRWVSENLSYLARSVDYGRTWTRINENLPRVAGRAIVHQEGTPGAMYVAMDQGIYYRDSTTAGWVRYGDGLPNVPVYDLKIDYRGSTIRAATHGRGVWEADLITPVEPVTALTVDKNKVCAGTTMQLMYNVPTNGTAANRYRVQLSDHTGSFSNLVTPGSSATNRAEVLIPSELPEGRNYRFRVMTNANRSTADTSDSFVVQRPPTATLSAAGNTLIVQRDDANALQPYTAYVSLSFSGTPPYQYTLSNGVVSELNSSADIVPVTFTETSTFTISSLSNVCGMGSVMGSARFVVTQVLGIPPAANPRVLISPNPATEQTLIETTLTGPLEVIVYDVLGHEVMRRRFRSRLELNLRSLPRGVYVYRISGNQSPIEGRLVVH
ncbi:hypothetical protein GCM10027423_47140 [Spirosoma arcticum]